jgi:hypothetical protein
MIFMLHLGLSLGLLSLAAGTALWIWSSPDRDHKVNIGRVVGLLIMILSIASISCSFYFGAQSIKEIYLFRILNNSKMSMNSEMMNR